MDKTPKLNLALLQASQAQKHVTVNEALAQIDAMSQLEIATAGAASAPAAPSEGSVHFVGPAADGAWTGHDGRLALFLNGGWLFVDPQPGWRAWLAEAGAAAVFDGAGWVIGAGAISQNGAGFVHRSTEFDHDIGAGASSSLVGALPANAIVYGITGRVLSTIGGAGTMQIGVAGSPDRYGSGIGTGAGSWARGITGSPLTYYAASDLVFTATGGTFDGTGRVRIAVHHAELTLPRA